jgi:hypothetical protein
MLHQKNEDIRNPRIIYFNEKYLGRYEMKVIPYQKLEEMTAERGRVRFGSIVFKSEEEEEVNLNKVPKDDIEEFVNALEEAINAIAAEPVSITRKKGMMGKMEWQFLKPPEMVFRSAPQAKPQTPSTSTDPLAALKMRFVRGEITEEEYKRMKEILE